MVHSNIRKTSRRLSLFLYLRYWALSMGLFIKFNVDRRRKFIWERAGIRTKAILFVTFGNFWYHPLRGRGIQHNDHEFRFLWKNERYKWPLNPSLPQTDKIFDSINLYKMYIFQRENQPGEENCRLYTFVRRFDLIAQCFHKGLS